MMDQGLAIKKDRKNLQLEKFRERHAKFFCSKQGMDWFIGGYFVAEWVKEFQQTVFFDEEDYY